MAYFFFATALKLKQVQISKYDHNSVRRVIKTLNAINLVAVLEIVQAFENASDVANLSKIRSDIYTNVNTDDRMANTRKRIVESLHLFKMEQLICCHCLQE